jgi:hypothetical protein
MDKYKAMTKKALGDYKILSARIKNIDSEIDYLHIELNYTKTAISKYNGVAVGGGSNASIVEIQAEEHAKINARIKELELEKKRYELAQCKINNIINSLPAEDREIIKRYYINGEKMISICADIYMTEKWGQERASRILGKVSFMLFGARNKDRELKLCV